jgi:hypothetical protein
MRISTPSLSGVLYEGGEERDLLCRVFSEPKRSVGLSTLGFVLPPENVTRTIPPHKNVLVASVTHKLCSCNVCFFSGAFTASPPRIWLSRQWRYNVQL